MIAVNYLAPWLLTSLLRERLVASVPAGVVVTASEAHRIGWSVDPAIILTDVSPFGPAQIMSAYGKSKLLDVLFTLELAERLKGTGVTANCCCPGVVASGLAGTNKMADRAAAALSRTPLVRRPDQGARVVVRLATDPAFATRTGEFISSTPFAGLLPTTPAVRDPRPPQRSVGSDQELARWDVKAAQRGLHDGTRLAYGSKMQLDLQERAGSTGEWKATACILCECNCGVEVRLGGADGRSFERIRGDKAHPASQGYTCEKALRLDHYQNGRHRLTTPMRRRPDGTYEPVDWDTAIAEVVAGFARVRDSHGGASIFYYGGGGQGNHLGGGYAAATRARARQRLPVERAGAGEDGRVLGQRQDARQRTCAATSSTPRWRCSSARTRGSRTASRTPARR